MGSRSGHQGRERLFKIGIWLKGLNGGLELIGALLLMLVPTSAFTKIILFLTQHETGAEPKDWIFRELSRGISHLSGESAFAIFYLVSHGAIKVFLAVALLREVRWAYPAGLVVFGLLAGYEVIRFVTHPGVMMGMIIAIDLGVIALIWSHWRSQGKDKGHGPGRHRRRHSHASA